MRNKLLLAILFILLLRGSCLEIPNLMEPTEGRYAAMAHRMVEMGDWTFPQFPRGNSYEQYLGKPPLFFWLTAISYKIFGFDEWVGRLPSFLGYVLVAISLIWAGVILKKEKLFQSAALIWCSSLIPFFFSGAIVLDVCLTATITLSLLAALLSVETKEKKIYPLVFWLSLSAGFLIKGPVAIILIGGPIFFYSIYKKSTELIRLICSPVAIACGILVAFPWFYIAQKTNPEFFSYFFIQENFLRYFVKDYGDRYGSGHTYPYGTAVGFFLLGIMPWCFFLLWAAIQKFIRKQLITSIQSELELPIAAIFFMVLFFCGMKQMHIGYLIPAIPWTAILISHWFQSSKIILKTACLTSFIYALTLFIAHPYIDTTNSATQIIACIAKNRPKLSEPVAVFGTKSYGSRLLRSGWELELEQPVPLTFINIPTKFIDLPHNLIIQSKFRHELNLKDFQLISTLGSWEWWARDDASGVVICKREDHFL